MKFVVGIAMAAVIYITGSVAIDLHFACQQHSSEVRKLFIECRIIP